MRPVPPDHFTEQDERPVLVKGVPMTQIGNTYVDTPSGVRELRIVVKDGNGEVHNAEIQDVRMVRP